MKIIRALKIHNVLIRQELKRFLEYKSDFIMGMLSFLFGQALNLLFIWILFSNIPDLMGWKLEEIIFLYGFSLIPKGIDHLLFDNLWNVSSFIIKNGDFDKYLIRPINPLFYIMTEKFQIDAFGELIMGMFLMGSALFYLSIEINILKILLFVLVIPFSTLIYTGLKIIAASLSFWIKQSGSFIYTIYMVSDFVRFPVTIYNSVIRAIITYIIPFAFAVFYPVKFFFTGETPILNIGLTILISVFLVLLSVFIWNKGMNNYESSGS